METIILRGESKANLKLLLTLAKKLNFSAKKLSAIEVEGLGIAISIEGGLKSGILSKKETSDFLLQLKHG